MGYGRNGEEGRKRKVEEEEGGGEGEIKDAFGARGGRYNYIHSLLQGRS